VHAPVGRCGPFDSPRSAWPVSPRLSTNLPANASAPVRGTELFKNGGVTVPDLREHRVLQASSCAGLLTLARPYQEASDHFMHACRNFPPVRRMGPCVPHHRALHRRQDFAKEQLDLVLQEFFLHPTGQIPANEWNFSDVNPPVHAWATIFLYRTEQALKGQGDLDFLKRSFAKLILNFSWWVNRKDRFGKNLFEGGFLGLDNIGVFEALIFQVVALAHSPGVSKTSSILPAPIIIGKGECVGCILFNGILDAHHD
jgi:hypothetical protein